MAFSVLGGILPIKSENDFAIVSSAEALSESETMLPYYYTLMTKEEKRLYLQAREAVMENKSKIKLMGRISEESLYKIICTLFYYDTLTFNLSSVDLNYTPSNAELKLEYSLDNDLYNEMLSEMDEISDEINAKFKESTSDYAKIKYIHDYIVSSTDYDGSDSFSHYAYGALKNGKAVCDGYSGAFAYLCGKAGIQTVNVIGDAKGEQHTWNKVYCGKNWYNVDITWDDPVTNLKENSSYNYFMITDETIGLTHTEKAYGFDSPAASDDTQSYFARNDLVASNINDAKNMLSSQMISAIEKGQTTASIQMKDQKTFNEVVSYLGMNNSKAAVSLLSSVKKKTDADIVETGMWSFTNPDTYTYTVCILYEDSSLSDYFYDSESLDDDTVSFFKKLGVNV